MLEEGKRPGANGDHGVGKRAVLYARVSTEEQAKKGYSLAGQLEILKGHAFREGLDVAEEVSDPGATGADLERRGIYRVRDLAVAGKIEVVLVQDVDRVSREPWHYEYLKAWLEDRGVGIRVLNDGGDDSPMGEFVAYVRRGVAKLERSDIARRTANGRLRKAREGRIPTPGRPRYGFRPDPAARCGWGVDEEKMGVVRRIFRMVADGVPYKSVGRTLEREGVPTPGGAEFWGRSTLRDIVEDDVYRPHAFEEVRALVTPDAVAGLDPELHYGVSWRNRRGLIKTRAAEPFGGGDEPGPVHHDWYDKPEGEWVPVPVPDSGVPRELVDAARAAVEGNRAPSRAGGWYCELSGGVAVCAECGRSMLARHKSTSKNGRRYEYGYYHCSRNQAHGAEACANSRNSSSQNLEEAVWGRVYSFLRRPDRLETGLDRLVEEQRGRLLADPAREIERLQEKLSALGRQRANYQRMAATGRVTFEELDERLAEVEEAKASARRELDALGRGIERLERLERERDAVLAHYKDVVPSLLRDLPPERRRRVHLALGTEARIDREGGVEVYLRKVRLTLDSKGGQETDRRFGKNGSFSSSTVTSPTSPWPAPGSTSSASR